MVPQTEFDLDGIQNIDQIIRKEVDKFNDMRSRVRDLKFVPVDPVTTYSSITYKSIDGGRMGVYFDPFEFDFIVVADSIGNELLRFLVPISEPLEPLDFAFLDNFNQVKAFVSLLGLNSIIDTSDILFNSEIAMELTEYACIIERLTRDKNEPIIVMKDGLLRTRAMKYVHLNKIFAFLKENKKRKLVGVAKRSKVLDLITSALYLEHIVPQDYTGYIEIPWEIEQLVYKRSKKETHLTHAFGKLYVAKLSDLGNFLVTVEIPYDFEHNEEIYSKRELNEIIGHLIKDSRGSYPTLGYPQTILRAHEKAVRWGFTASIWRDKIIERVLDKVGDDRIQIMMKESNFLREHVQKEFLGGA